MRIDKFTQKMQEAVQASQDVASEFNQQEIIREPVRTAPRLHKDAALLCLRHNGAATAPKRIFPSNFHHV